MADHVSGENVLLGADGRNVVCVRCECSRRFKRDLVPRRRNVLRETKPNQSLIQLESLILAQNERWRQA